MIGVFDGRGGIRKMGEEYVRFFGGEGVRPARSCVAVGALLRGVVVDGVCGVAVKGGGRVGLVWLGGRVGEKEGREGGKGKKRGHG